MLPQSYRPRRSALFVPADNQRALQKISSQLQADCIILDLEDAVSDSNKENARAELPATLSNVDTGGRELLLRINASDSAAYQLDLEVALELPIDAIVLPKVEEPQQVSELANSLPEHIRLWAMIETARGVLNAAKICSSSSRLDAMMVGTQDLALDLQLRPESDNSEIIDHCLMQCLLAARATNITAIDSVCPEFKNLDPLREECSKAINRGYDGKASIHPAQLPMINSSFSPESVQLEQARTIVEAWNEAQASGRSVANLDGRMIEHLHATQASLLLERAAAIVKLHGAE